MDSLNLNVENRIRVNLNVIVFLDVFGKSHFANMFNLAEFFQNFGIVNRLVEKVKLFRMTVPNSAADCLVDKSGKFRVRAHQPAAVSDTVRLVVEHTRPIFVKVVQCRRFQNVGVDSCNAVHGVRTDYRKARHMDFVCLDD